MPSRCSNTVCPPTSRMPPTHTVIGSRTLWRTLGAKWLASAAASSPKKLTGPTTAVAVATSAAIQSNSHKVLRV